MASSIFDSAWFTLERPAFRKIAALSDPVLSVMLILAAIVLVIIAMRPGHPLFKAVVFSYVILP